MTTVATTRLTPFDFQADTINKLSKQKSRLCGHDMGLGKTLIGVELDIKNRSQDESGRRLKTLIVTPKGVIADGAWQRALASQADTSIPVYVLGKDRAAFERAASDGRKPGYFICHWEALRLMPGLRKVDWFHIIADEVHRAKSRKAQQTQSLKSLRTEYKTGLSGTPADNKPQDLWSILNWLWPSYYTSYWSFLRHYCVGEMSPQGYQKITGVQQQNLPALHKEMEPWYDRKLKEDVLKDLPEKYNRAIWVDLLPAQRRAYDQMKKELIAWLGQQDQEKPLIAPVVVAQLQRLQMFALASAEIVGYKDKENAAGEKVTTPLVKLIEPSSKIDTLMELLEDTDLDSEPVVVFSQFKGAIRILGERCQKSGISIATFTGDTKEADRKKAIADFQAGKTQVFAGTIAAGGVGITLTRASTVVFLDRAWSPSMNRQAEDRLHRIGQKNAVQVIDIMARNTVDLGRRQKIDQKWEWLQQLLGDK
jgi:SNF2 family DNA or RNA helicase